MLYYGNRTSLLATRIVVLFKDAIVEAKLLVVVKWEQLIAE